MNSKSIHNASKGYSLVEILVVVSIVTLIMSTVLFSYRSFTDRLAVSSAAQEIATTIREAQTYGLSVKQATNGNFIYAYGVYFDMNDPRAYYLFVDKNSNGIYDGTTNCSESTECVEKGMIRDAASIKNLCGKSFGATEYSCPVQNSTQMSILFKRPRLEAIINFSNTFGTILGPFESSTISISSRNQNITLTLESSGQVSIH